MKLLPTSTAVDMFKVGQWIRIKYKPVLGRDSGLVYDGLSGKIIGTVCESFHIQLDEESMVKVKEYNDTHYCRYRSDPVIPKSYLMKVSFTKLLENEQGAKDEKGAAKGASEESL